MSERAEAIQAAEFVEEDRIVAFFEPPFGLLGVDTNGAPPQPVIGLVIESRVVFENMGKGEEVSELFFLQALLNYNTDDDGNEICDGEAFACSSDLRDIERIIGAIASTTIIPGHNAKIVGDGLGAYHNKAQVKHDFENTTDECVDGVFCVVEPATNGFMLKMQQSVPRKGRGPGSWVQEPSCTISSLNGRLSPESVKNMLTQLSAIRDKRDIAVAKLEKFKPEDEPAPALSM